MQRRKILLGGAGAMLLGWALLIAAHFPYDVDRPLTQDEIQKARDYYTAAYDDKAPRGTLTPQEAEYVKRARSAYASQQVQERLEEFINQHHLSAGKALEIGAGQGLLQDVMADYTALEIAPTSRRYFHKPFVTGSATSLPFNDNSFDVIWSIQVLEHVPNPEQALSEMRRVVKDGGYLYMRVAWGCEPWYAQGYEVRPYSDFDWKGKLIKASIPIRANAVFRALHVFPIRGLRALAYMLSPSPTALHYRRLSANYKEYWVPDSDAVNNLDRQDAYLWYASRGDKCLNCLPPWQYAFRRVGDGRLLIQVHKSARK